MAQINETENAFLEGFEQFQILRPSKAYNQACQSYPCRISELVFGSLLASYILGLISVGASFISVAAVQLKTGETDLVQIGTGFLNYLIISVCFSYLTAALYTTYHNSILTMPNVPISDLTNDFGIAMLQAVCFGISMIWQNLFLFFLGIILVVVFYRQNAKFRRLARFFYDKLKQKEVIRAKIEKGASARETSNEKKAAHRLDHEVRTSFEKMLKETNLHPDHAGCLNGWERIKGGLLFKAYGMVIFGCLIGAGGLELLPDQWKKLPDPDQWKKLGLRLSWADVGAIFQTVVYLIVGILFLRATISILRAKSISLNDLGRPIIERMDNAASELARAITDPTPKK